MNMNLNVNSHVGLSIGERPLTPKLTLRRGFMFRFTSILVSLSSNEVRGSQ